MNPSLASAPVVSPAPVVTRAAAASTVEHADDETLLCRAIVALSAVRQVARKMVDHPGIGGSLWSEAAAADVLAGYILDSFSPLLPRRHADLDETLRLIRQPLGVDVVANVPGAGTVEEALHGAYRAVLVVAARVLGDVWGAHADCPDCELCKRICGQTSALRLLRDVAQDGAQEVDREVFGSFNAEKAAKRMGAAELQEIAVRFARLASEVASA